jgi:protein gp37
MYRRFKWNPEVRFDYSELDAIDGLKRTSNLKIFIGSTHDIFGSWIPDEWIRTIILKAVQNPWFTFIFLTKNPNRYSDFTFPRNAWIGYSTTNTLYHEWDERHQDNIKFVSLEPIQAAMTVNLEGYAQRIDFDWLLVGKETGHRKGRVFPKSTWIGDIIGFCRKANIKLFLKDNLNYFLKIQEYPEVIK